METTNSTPAPKARPRKKPPEPSSVRTDRDWVMIAIGVFLIVFFVAAGYFSVIKTNKNSPLRKKGPVKAPKRQGFLDENTNSYKTAMAMQLLPRLRDRGSVKGPQKGSVTSI